MIPGSKGLLAPSDNKFRERAEVYGASVCTYMSENLTNRKRQALETRKRILTCALDLFEKKGFEEVTIQDIAEAAQTSVGSIYRYFKNKDEIAAQNTELLDDLYMSFYEQLIRDEKYNDLSAMDKLARFYLFVQKSVSDYSNLRSLYIYNLRNQEEASTLTDGSRALYQIYHSLYESCRKDDSIRPDLDEQEFCDLMIQSSRGILLDWLLRRKEFNVTSQALKWWNIIFSYIRKSL